jgi:flagellar motor switch/type III secretory pathway protein FliN
VRAYPFDRLSKLTRAEARAHSAIAGWLAVRAPAGKLAALVGGPVTIGRPTEASKTDPHAARCQLRIAGTSLQVVGSSRAVRRLAQRLLGGPVELDAPRPLNQVEEAVWTLVVATAVEDLAIAGEVIPGGDAHASVLVAFDLMLGEIAASVELRGPALELRVPPARPLPGWAARATLEVPIVVGRCALPVDVVGRLAVRDIITLDRPAGDAELVIFGGAIGLRAAPNAVSAAASTSYVPRDMSLPDDAHVELTVALGTTQLSLRQVLDLAVGQVVQLGRPLAGPFELRAAGRIVGRGELVDVDGELGVRIVSIES